MWLQRVVDEIMNLIFTGPSPYMCEESCHLKVFSV